MAKLKTPTAETFAGHIAREIRGEMGRQGVTQESLALKLGWSQRMLSRRLTAEVPINADETEAIACALGVPLTQFFATRSSPT